MVSEYNWMQTNSNVLLNCAYKKKTEKVLPSNHTVIKFKETGFHTYILISKVISMATLRSAKLNFT